MSSRERWTIYPLLFLALGTSIRDKIFGTVNTETVFCKSLYVTDRQSRAQVTLASTDNGGLVQTTGKGRPLLMFGNYNQEAGIWVANTEDGGIRGEGLIFWRSPPRKPAIDVPPEEEPQEVEPPDEPPASAD